MFLGNTLTPVSFKTEFHIPKPFSISLYKGAQGVFQCYFLVPCKNSDGAY